MTGQNQTQNADALRLLGDTYPELIAAFGSTNPPPVGAMSDLLRESEAWDESILGQLVCEYREADWPRLVYADWLEEQTGTVACPQECDHGYTGRYDSLHQPIRCSLCKGSGRVPDGNAQRAEHIRWAVANPRDSAVCLCGCRGREPNPCEICRMMSGEVAAIPRRADGESHYVLNRGFVCEVRLSSADWLSHADHLYWHPRQTVACGHCVGRRPGSRDAWKIQQPCRVCDGSGRVPRPWPGGCHPLREVTLTGLPHTTIAFDWNVWGKCEINWRERTMISDKWSGITFYLP